MSGFDLLYAAILTLASPLVALRLPFDRKNRQSLNARLSGLSNQPTPKELSQKNGIWVHAASIGEANLAMMLIDALRRRGLNRHFVLSVNTRSAFDSLKHRKDLKLVMAPFDLSPSIKAFIRRWQVRDLILIETEIWPNMIALIKSKGKVVLINGRLSDRHFQKYQRLRPLLKSSFQKIDLVLAQDQVALKRFEDLGVDAAKLKKTGNIKYDVKIEAPKDLVEKLKEEYGIQKGDFLFLAGSIQPEEMEPVLRACQPLMDEIDRFRILCVPRHPEKKEEFRQALERFGMAYRFASDKDGMEQSSIRAVQIVDRIGELKAWYHLADSVFVGGSLCNRGGQNMLEPIGFAKPVCVGPYATNFKSEVNLLLKKSGLKVVKDAVELRDFVRFCAGEPKQAVEMGQKGLGVLNENKGALDATIKELDQIL